MTGRLAIRIRARQADPYEGRHRIEDLHPSVPTGYSPLAPAIRQDLAPTYYADRHLPAGDAMERTGLLDLTAITTALNTGEAA